MPQRSMRAGWVLMATLLTFILWTSAASAQDAATASPTTSQTAVRVRLADGTVAWYKPAEDGSGEYVYSDALNTTPGRFYFFPHGWTWPAALLFLYGLLGQLMFMGRFLTQWIASERAGRSVVPTSFWFQSLLGASILLSYFVLRRDLIGVFGQLFGWPIYLRNVVLIRRTRQADGQALDEPR